MISLLTDMGVQLQARPSGSACLRVLYDNLEYIEDRLAHPPVPAPKRDIPPFEPDTDDVLAPDVAPPADDVAPEPQETPRALSPPVIDHHFDDNVQCDNSLLAEAHERMVSCVITSFRTDAGLIMLENELSMFEESTQDNVSSWVHTMRNAWSSRLHSKVLDDFCEALDLWVLSQNVMVQGRGQFEERKEE